VVAQHVVKDDDGQKITEEKAYPGESTADGEPGLLDEETRSTKHPKASEAGGKATDFWRLTPACLQLDKDKNPKLALGIHLNLPKGEALALIAELKKRYGRNNVTEMVELVSRGRETQWLAVGRRKRLDEARTKDNA
jgi:hypothetical protein